MMWSNLIFQYLFYNVCPQTKEFSFHYIFSKLCPTAFLFVYISLLLAHKIEKATFHLGCKVFYLLDGKLVHQNHLLNSLRDVFSHITLISQDFRYDKSFHQLFKEIMD